MMRESETGDPVEVLAGRFAEEYCRDLDPSIEDYARRFPEHAEAIRELFPTLIVEELAARFLQQQRAGLRPKVEDYARDHPEYATQIRELIPALVRLHQRTTGKTTAPAGSTTFIAPPPLARTSTCSTATTTTEPEPTQGDAWYGGTEPRQKPATVTLAALFAELDFGRWKQPPCRMAFPS